MKLYIRQKLFSVVDRFTIKNEHLEDIYFGHGKFFTFAKQLTITDNDNQEVLFLKERLWHFFPHIDVHMKNQTSFLVKKMFAFFTQKYEITPLNWEVEGNFWAHQYRIFNENGTIATIEKAWLSLSDYYEVDIVDSKDTLAILGIVLAIDIAMSKAAAANSSSSH